MSAMVIHEQVASAVNRLLKYFCKSAPRQNVTSLTFLWCGDRGLIPSIHLVFSYGFRSTRLFQRRAYIWDYFEKVAAFFSIELGMNAQNYSTPPSPSTVHTPQPKSGWFSTHSLPRPPRNRITHSFSSAYAAIPHSPSFSLVRDEHDESPSGLLPSSRLPHNAQAFSQPNSPAVMRIFTANTVEQQQHQKIFPDPKQYNNAVNLTVASCQSMALLKYLAAQFVESVRQVSASGPLLGKEGKLQRFLCRAVRDHLLAGWFSVLALSPVTSQMYESKSFLLNPELRLAIQSLIAALDEIEFAFEPVLLGDE